MPDVLTPVTITAPTGVDGYSGVATLNNSADSDFVGYLFKASGFGGAGIRLSKDDVPEGHGANLGSSLLSERSFTLEIAMRRGTTTALSKGYFQKLCRAVNAMSADALFSWTAADGSITKWVNFRLEQGPSEPDPETAHSLVGCICADPRIYSSGGSVGASTSQSITNAGNTDTPYWSVIIASPSATCVITNSTTGKTFTFTGLNGGGSVAIDFKARTITQGGVSKQGAVSASSSWFALAPGANSLTCTNAMSLSWNNAWSSD